MVKSMRITLCLRAVFQVLRNVLSPSANPVFHKLHVALLRKLLLSSSIPLPSLDTVVSKPPRKRGSSMDYKAFHGFLSLFDIQCCI
mmetsp:Transcript_20105/g.28311  ORF Transcript_20105/g.28311 Transcript_20105/m.28311 type:complete len:86 (+) Transcript_20105:986-1243(+)